jgi:hypothetical protein
MAGKAKNAAQKPAETSEDIAALTQAFLKQGGEIQKIDQGVSGQVNNKASKHISLGKSSANR